MENPTPIVHNYTNVDFWGLPRGQTVATNFIKHCGKPLAHFNGECWDKFNDRFDFFLIIDAYTLFIRERLLPNTRFLVHNFSKTNFLEVPAGQMRHCEAVTYQGCELAAVYHDEWKVMPSSLHICSVSKDCLVIEGI